MLMESISARVRVGGKEGILNCHFFHETRDDASADKQETYFSACQWKILLVLFTLYVAGTV